MNIKLLTLAFFFGFSFFSQKLFHPQRVIATISDQTLVEASGLEESYTNPGYFWTHNDSGGDPALYLIDTTGSVKMIVMLEGLTNRDWEEIVTIRRGGKSWIYVAEIGDNKAVHEQVSLIEIQEPKYQGNTNVVVAAKDIKIMSFQYAEGARDAEALLFDSQSNEFVLITKREENSMVYSFPFQSGDEIITVTSKGSIPSRNFTAADANETGEVLLKHYNAIFFWGASNQRIADRILQWNPVEIPYTPEPQGEAICWMGKDFYTISEKNKGKPQEMLVFKRMP